MHAKVKSKARNAANFWDRAYKPTVEIEYSDEEVATSRSTSLIPSLQNHLHILRSRTPSETAVPTLQTTTKLHKEADKVAAKKNTQAKVPAAAKKLDQLVLCQNSGPCEKARVKHEAHGEPHICRCYDKKTANSRIGFPRGDRTWKQKPTSAGHQGGRYKLAIGFAFLFLLIVALRYYWYIETTGDWPFNDVSHTVQSVCSVWALRNRLFDPLWATTGLQEGDERRSYW